MMYWLLTEWGGHVHEKALHDSNGAYYTRRHPCALRVSILSHSHDVVDLHVRATNVQASTADRLVHVRARTFKIMRTVSVASARDEVDTSSGWSTCSSKMSEMMLFLTLMPAVLRPSAWCLRSSVTACAYM